MAKRAILSGGSTVVFGTLTRMIVNAGLKLSSESQTARDLTHAVGKFINDSPGGETLKNLGHEVLNLLPGPLRSGLEPVYHAAVYGSLDKEDAVPPNKKGQKKDQKKQSSPQELVQKGRALVLKLGTPFTPGILGWMRKLGPNEQNRVYQFIGKDLDTNSLKALYDAYGDNADPKEVFGFNFSGSATRISGETEPDATARNLTDSQMFEPTTHGEAARIVMSWIAEKVPGVYNKFQDVLARSTGSDSREDRTYFDAYMASYYVVGKEATVHMFGLLSKRDIEELGKITNVRPNTLTKIKLFFQERFQKLTGGGESMSDDDLQELYTFLNGSLKQRKLDPLPEYISETANQPNS